MPKRNSLKPCLQGAATQYLPSCAALWEGVGIITLLLETKLTLLVRDEGSSRPCFAVEDRFPISPRWAQNPCSFHCVILIGWSRKQGDSMASSLMGLGFKNTNTNKRANNQIPGEMMHVCKNCVKNAKFDRNSGFGTPLKILILCCLENAGRERKGVHSMAMMVWCWQLSERIKRAAQFNKTKAFNLERLKLKIGERLKVYLTTFN